VNVTTLIAQVPDSLYRQIVQLAGQESMSIDQLVALALSAQLSAWQAKQYLEGRAERGDWNKFQQILGRVPDVEPSEEDRID
jgi:hypothetical protein